MNEVNFQTRDEDDWPEEAIAACRASGLLTADVESHCHWEPLLDRLRSIGYGDLTVGRIVEGHLNGWQLVCTFGDADQVRLLRSRINEGGLSAIWDSELPGRGLTLQPRDSGRFVLQGTKHFASAAGRANYPVVTATRSDHRGRVLGRQLLLLPMDELSSVVDRSRERPLGVRAAETYSVSFPGCELDASWLIGVPGDYQREPMLTAGGARFLALQVGALERLFELVRRDHQRFGAPGRTAAGRRAAQLASAVWQARAGLDQLTRSLMERFPGACSVAPDQPLLGRAAERARQQWKVDRICSEVLVARHVIEERAHEALRLAEQAVGLKGMVPPHPLERLLRDLTVYLRQPCVDTSLDRVGDFVTAGSPGHNAAELWEPSAEYRLHSRLIDHSSLAAVPSAVDDSSCIAGSTLGVLPPDTVHQLGRTIVAAPHPDDETLGAGGIVALLRQREIPVCIVFLTDGEASHPGSQQYSQTELAKLRRGEALRAAGELGVDDVRFMEFPDGSVPGAKCQGFEEAASQLQALVEDFQPHSILTTWRRDRHGDHRAAYQLCVKASREARPHDPPRVIEFPIWVYEPRTPEEAPRDDEVKTVRLDIREVRDQKESALRCHASQLGHVITDDESGFQLNARHLARFGNDFEVLLVPVDQPRDTVPTTYFDAKYAQHHDPWNYEHSGYERNKYEKLLSVLPQAEYRRGLELGCSIGVLTTRLAPRCQWLTAIEGSRRAACEAQRRATEAGLENVQVVRGRLPYALPDSSFDLIVLSEVGYYFEPSDMCELAASIARRLLSGGDLVLMHWTVYVEDYPMTGDAVHEAFARVARLHGLSEVSSGREPFYRWDVYRAGGTGTSSPPYANQRNSPR